MTLSDQPDDLGFGIDSTATEVLAGIDLSGRFAIVTGGYSGLGLATTRALAAAGARVLVPARRTDVAREAVAGIAGVEVDELDLADLGSVRNFADRVLDAGRPIDILINNAGIMATPLTRVGEGWEAQFATNHLGHYALVNRLWPALTADGGARVVVVASGAGETPRINWDDVHFQNGYDKWAAYSQSKSANILFAAELDRLGRAAGVRALSVNPGYILTPLQRHLSKEEMVGAGWIDENGTALLPEFRAPEQGAATQVWAATSPRLADAGGGYCQACTVAKTFDGPADREAAERLWALSAELTGVDAFGKSE
ncbi:oxidoreductase [Micromonospora endolithica]|uniref:Probable oxidoreductase n=1 Tax=Micromonospora endolithica TaxID=230091 RepID=A0A3A9ZME0_9ACTN|nr:oxidoreductase [Micromonospora endolithica]RKN49480.1 SDR family NAD(P)-dependent oxidoreductase [Micromonospora endolithica]TWJ23684.1 NAD(P)-dependent dehydrogenase (short-subunit alcohol dehydrogenase family) [Micromonospora endolithica]